MKVVFILPGSGQSPAGGFKVVYEYANGLSRLGHQATVVHAPYRTYGEATVRRGLRQIGVYWLRLMGVKGGYKPKRWFERERPVKYLWRPSLHAAWIPPADVCVATAWESAEWLASYPEQKGRKFYLIQHLEGYFRGADEQRVEATWKLPLKKIVIAMWLQEHASALGEESTYIPNGLDFGRFNLDTSIAGRESARVAMLYHAEEWKGTAIGLQALQLAKRTSPELQADLFGVPPQPRDLPSWITYHRNPPQEKLRGLYNAASIFVAPSFVEGWGLPPTEAMQCGCAVCATDIGGHREFAINGKTALVSPAGDVRCLAENIQRLIHEPDLHANIANEGCRFVQQFTWERAVRSFDAAIRA